MSVTLLELALATALAAAMILLFSSALVWLVGSYRVRKRTLIEMRREDDPRGTERNIARLDAIVRTNREMARSLNEELETLRARRAKDAPE